jgi:hypothetical protein
MARRLAEIAKLPFIVNRSADTVPVEMPKLTMV